MKTTQNWTARVWGTRGAIPIAAANFLTYGGNTSCLSVDCGELMVFDAGSGIVRLGEELVEQGGPKRVHIWISHLHLDHILGLVGFPLLHDPSAEIHLYGERRGGLSFREQLECIFTPPYWPLSLADFQANIIFHEIEPGGAAFPAEGLTVYALRGCHPNHSLIYRLEGAGRSVVYTLDCELTAPMTSRLTEFARDCDLLVWDANFVTEDLQKGWGHSTWEQGIEVGRAAGAKKVLMTHFSHTYTDRFLEEQERLAQQKSGACAFAREGMVINL